MTYLPSLPPGAVLMDVFRARPEIYRPLLDFHQALLRGPSPLSVADRELIAAYVSGPNTCGYCHRGAPGHRTRVRRSGGDPDSAAG